MANFKNLVSSIFTTLFFPNKATINSTSNKLDTPSEAAECAVCLSPLKGEETGTTRVLTCQHEFHCSCVEKWLDVPYFKNTCPICRFSIVQEDDETSSTRAGGGDDRGLWKLQDNDQWLTEEMVIWFSSFHVAGF